MTVYPNDEAIEEIRMTMRLNCRLPATLEILSSGLRIRGDVMDASETGLFFRSELLLPVGTAVRVELVAQGRGLASMDAEVVRVVSDAGAAGMGVRFCGPIEPASRFML